MTPDISDLTSALDLADGYLTLRMWEHAWNAIEDVPTHWKSHPAHSTVENLGCMLS